MFTLLYSAFLLSFFAGIVIIAVLLAISEKTHFLVDVPDGDALKIHKKSIPLLGGLAMLVSAVIGAGIFFGQSSDIKLIVVFIALLPVFFLGLYDDLKWKHISTIKPRLKFIFLIICTFVPSVVLSLADIRFNFLPFTIIPLLLGFAYIFVCINAINYQDGMDGLAGGEVFISLTGFLFLALATGNFFATIICLIFLAVILAFLAFNFPPAKTFMGDSGAYLLGFMLALLVFLFSKPYNIYSVVAPIFIIGLPIFDGVFTNIRRLMHGKSIFLGDRSHFYDRLLKKGFSTKKTLVICYTLQIISVIAGVLLYK